MNEEKEELKVEIPKVIIEEIDLNFKLIVLGDSGVGKSCLTLKALKDTFRINNNITVGFEFYTFHVKINDKLVKLQIWDTCGHEMFRSLITSFYRNSSLVLLVYSITDKDSFNHLDFWLKELRRHANPDVITFLIGNKIDLEDNRMITKEEMNAFAKENNFDYVEETSAKTGFNAKEVFIEAAKVLYLKQKKYLKRINSIGVENNIVLKPYTDSLSNSSYSINSEIPDKGCC